MVLKGVASIHNNNEYKYVCNTNFILELQQRKSMIFLQLNTYHLMHSNVIVVLNFKRSQLKFLEGDVCSYRLFKRVNSISFYSFRLYPT